jgi:hypothetical protein
MGYFDTLYNRYLNKYKKNLKNEKKKFIDVCSSTYGLMVIQILCNFIII